MNLFFISIFLLFDLWSYSFARVVGRWDTSCGYLSQKIYCFGGSTGPITGYNPDSSLMYLDIADGSGDSAEELSDKWITIAANTNGINIQTREYRQSMVLPDGKTMLLSGGWNIDTAGLVSQTIAYNADNNSWSRYPSYTEPPFGVRQIYYASSVYIPDYGVGFYGGFEANINKNWTYRGQNMSSYGFKDTDNTRSIGYTSLTFFDIRKKVDPWFVFPTQNNLPTDFPSFQTSIFDTLRNKIFFLGGGFRNGTFSKNVYYSFETSMTFDVTSGNWGSQVLGGPIPSKRKDQSTTLLSSTNRDVLLYGGEDPYNDSRPCQDYLFTLNLDSYVWKQHNIQNRSTVNLIRSRHSAVPVYNDTLFIVFGRDASGLPVSSIVILNVTDPSNISYLSSYVDPNGVTRSISSTGLNTGAKAGIIVGAVAGGLVILSSIFCLWKKNKEKRKKEEMDEIQRQNERIESHVMEVNWEAIDKNLSYPRQLEDESTTVVLNKPEFSTGTQLVPDTIEGYSKSPSVTLEKPDGL